MLACGSDYQYPSTKPTSIDVPTFVPPYWINQYTCPDDMSTHVGICVTLTAGVCTGDTNNIVLALEKENTELIVDMKLHEFYTDTTMLDLENLEDKFGKIIAPHLQIALEKKMSFMRGSKRDSFIFRARIPLGVAVNPLIAENDWHLMGDNKGNRCLMIVLKTPKNRILPGTRSQENCHDLGCF